MYISFFFKKNNLVVFFGGTRKDFHFRILNFATLFFLFIRLRIEKATTTLYLCSELAARCSDSFLCVVFF